MAQGKDKDKTALFSVYHSRSKSVNVFDMAVLPDTFKKYKDPEPDKTAIKEAIKNGENVPGAEIVESTSLVIR